MWLSLKTRPDTVFAAGKLARYTHRPTDLTADATKHLLRYYRGTPRLGLELGGASGNLTIYSDATYNDCPDTSRSTTGIAIRYGARIVY